MNKTPAAFMMQPTSAQILVPTQKAGLPVIMVQGGKDPVVPPQNTRQWVEALVQQGIEHRYIELPEGDHGTITGDGMADIFRVFAAHSRMH